MNAPPPYAGQQGVSAQSQQSASGFIFMDVGYIKRPSGGVLKIIEMVLCLIVIICNNIDLYWQPLGGGWVNFVVIIAIFGAAFTLFVNMYDLPSKMVAAGTYRLGEFVYHIFWTVLWLIAGIVAAARASGRSSVAACAVFCFLTLVVFAVDSYFAHVAWRQGGHASDGSAPYNNFPDSQQGTMNVGGLNPPPPSTSAGPNANAGAFPYSSQPVAGATSGYAYGEKPVY